MPSPSPITLRPALPTDAPQISRLGHSVFTTAFGHAIPAADLASYLASTYSASALAGDIANPNITTVVACSNGEEDGGEVVAFAQLTEGTMEKCVEDCESPVELQRLYVLGEWAGKGIGKMLMERMVEIARQKGKKTLWLGVWEENVKAQAVYKKFGFERVGEHKFVIGSKVDTDWIMVYMLKDTQE
ncbi:Spermidine/spermine N(1)-acetyltransferase [Lachnellula suecica]|uniref:Spermidine/spermine N(1)-acetyltransferase n=1 Tax=Lachnellula suecica TaxID=602035 RepID=A0A8T9BUQ0_9HELO|nr:Spermidine/spermine N(1)-acetyltransferase [Lachnellula suecica]